MKTQLLAWMIPCWGLIAQTSGNEVSVEQAPAVENPRKPEAVEVVRTPKRVDEAEVGKVLLRGPVVTLTQAKRPLQAFNPFVKGLSPGISDEMQADPILRGPRGIVLLRVDFGRSHP